jgi:hypothetical protein
MVLPHCYGFRAYQTLTRDVYSSASDELVVGRPLPCGLGGC